MAPLGYMRLLVVAPDIVPHFSFSVCLYFGNALKATRRMPHFLTSLPLLRLRSYYALLLPCFAIFMQFALWGL